MNGAGLPGSANRLQLARERARQIRHLFLDVDGVMTDGGLYFDAQGETLKRFHVQDGQGIKQLLAAGIGVGIVSGRSHPAVVARARELGLHHVFLGVSDKRACLVSWCESSGVSPEACGHMGDDTADLDLMRAVGLPMSVPNAVESVREAALWVSQQAGGSGAVREAAEFILESRK